MPPLPRSLLQCNKGRRPNRGADLRIVSDTQVYFCSNRANSCYDKWGTVWTTSYVGNQHEALSTGVGMEAIEGLRFLASLPLASTGRTEGGKKTQPFKRFHSRLLRIFWDSNHGIKISFYYCLICQMRGTYKKNSKNVIKCCSYTSSFRLMIRNRIL